MEKHIRDPGLLMKVASFILDQAFKQEYRKYNNDDLADLENAAGVLRRAGDAIAKRIAIEWVMRDERRYNAAANALPTHVGADGRLVVKKQADRDSDTA